MVPNPTIERVQPDLVAKLQSEALFAPIVIFKEREQRESSDLDERLSNVTGDGRQGPLKRPGASITVKMPTFSNANVDAPGPLAVLNQVIVVKSNDRINIETKDAAGVSIGTGVSAEQWAQNLWQTLHLFTLQGVAQTLYATTIKKTDAFAHLDLLAYEVSFQATFPLQAPLFVYTPTPSNARTVVTLTPTPAPPGGQSNPQPASQTIFYTIDGSFPGSGNSKALIYTAPFNVLRGIVIRWAAYAAGYNGSDVGLISID
jgi:hypothetical protein